MNSVNVCLLESEEFYTGDEAIKMQSCIRLQMNETKTSCRKEKEKTSWARGLTEVFMENSDM